MDGPILGVTVKVGAAGNLTPWSTGHHGVKGRHVSMGAPYRVSRNPRSTGLPLRETQGRGGGPECACPPRGLPAAYAAVGDGVRAQLHPDPVGPHVANRREPRNPATPGAPWATCVTCDVCDVWRV